MSDLERVKGSIPPVVTPIRDGAVDYDAYAGLVEFQVGQGSHGILVNGTTAEPSTLTTEERNRLVDIAIDTVDGKIPVVAATGSQSLAETEVLTKHAVDAGADALLIVTPYYIKPPQRGLIEYYLHLAKQHQTPWMIYHIPSRTAINVMRRIAVLTLGLYRIENDIKLLDDVLDQSDRRKRDPVAAFLWSRRHVSPFLFGEYLAFNGFGRVFIEQLRVNPEVALGLTEPQWIGIGLVLAGVGSVLFFHSRAPAPA